MLGSEIAVVDMVSNTAALGAALLSASTADSVCWKDLCASAIGRRLRIVCRPEAGASAFEETERNYWRLLADNFGIHVVAE